MSTKSTPAHIKLDERNHVEKPFLDQLAGLGWLILDLEKDQKPADTGRSGFTEVVLEPRLRAQLQVINPWLQDDHIDDVVKQLTASFPGSDLMKNNQHLLHLLLEGTSVGENHATGETSPTVKFVDLGKVDNNDFTAVCQFKLRVPGTEHHIIPDIVLFLNSLPAVLVECKSPKVNDALASAIDQMLRYSEQRGVKGEGHAQLFWYNQFVIATCRQQAKFGTISTHTEKYFYRWADPYPRSVEELDHGSGSPNNQQRLVGLLHPGQQSQLQLAADQSPHVRDRLRDRPRAGAPDRSQPYATLLERRERSVAHHGARPRLVARAWAEP